MRLRSHSFPKQAPAPQRDGRPALGRRCHAKALRWRFFPLRYDLIRALSLGGSRPRRLANLTRETLDSRARTRAEGFQVFQRGVIKCQFGYRKVRYRGIAKNGAQVFSLLALANLYLALARKTIRAGGDVLFAGRSGRTTGELPVLKAADKRWKSCRAQHTIRFSSSGDGRRFWQRHAVI